MTAMAPVEASQVLVSLRMQRAILTRIAAELATALRGLTVPADGSWRSNAQREFAHALEEVHDLLHTAWRAVDAAVAEIDSDIAAVGAILPTAGAT